MYTLGDKKQILVKMSHTLGINRHTLGIKQQTFTKKRHTLVVKRHTFTEKYPTFTEKWHTFTEKRHTLGVKQQTFPIIKLTFNKSMEIIEIKTFSQEVYHALNISWEKESSLKRSNHVELQ